MFGIAFDSVIGGLQGDAGDHGASDGRRDFEARRLAAGAGVEVQILRGLAIDGVGDRFRARAVGGGGDDRVARLGDVLHLSIQGGGLEQADSRCYAERNPWVG